MSPSGAVHERASRADRRRHPARRERDASIASPRAPSRSVPFLALGVVGWQVWADLLHWHDIAVFAILYLLTGLGVTVGLPPLSHPPQLRDQPRRARRPRRARLGGDRGPRDLLGGRPPQAPRLLRPRGRSAQPARRPRRRLAGRAAPACCHAHVGWLFIHTQRGAQDRYAPDLIDDPVVRFVDRTFVLWVAGRAGACRSGSGSRSAARVVAGLTGLLWGGAVRMFVLHHVTYSINSLCHFFGRAAFATDDDSRNLLVAGAALDRRVLAQQPPRLPDLRRPRAAPGSRSTSPRCVIIRAREGRAWSGTSFASVPSGRRARRQAAA